MALDKIKTDIIADTNVTIAKLATNTGIKSDRHTIPSVTTSERDAGSFNAAVGDIIYNSSLGNLQQYTAAGWQSISAPPSIAGITYPTESGAVLTALDASGGTEAAQTLLINGSDFSATVTVEIQVGGNFVAFASSTSVNSSRTQITCTGVTKRAAADNYTLKVTNTSGLSASTTVNFSADPSFSTAASLGHVYSSLTLNKSIAFTGTKVIQGATAKPTWMTVTGATSSADNGSGDTTFDATGSPATLGGTIAVPASSANSQLHTFSIIVRDAENQTFNRDFTLTARKIPISTNSGGVGTITTYSGYRVHSWTATGEHSSSFTIYTDTVVDMLVVGGGGGGGAIFSGGGKAGGGGAGGMRVFNNLTLTAGTYTVKVGGGGAGATYNGSVGRSGTKGVPSYVERVGGTSAEYKANGGGTGGGVDHSGGQGGSGGGAGSYGGGGRDGGAGNEGGFSPNEGYNGGGSSGGGTAGGGGGASGTGTANGDPAAGGAGATNNFRTGSNVTYSTGGTGAKGSATSNGTANSGEGGQGAGTSGGSGSAGGSGIVVIRYAV